MNSAPHFPMAANRSPLAALHAPGWYFTAVALVLTAVAFGSILVLAYWATDTTRPLQKIEGRFLKWDEHNPDLLWIEWQGERVRACPGHINRFLITSWTYSLPTTALPYPDGLPLGPIHTHIPIHIPAHLDGPFKLRTRIDYGCNPLQRVLPFSVELPDIAVPKRPGDNNHGRPLALPSAGSGSP